MRDDTTLILTLLLAVGVAGVVVLVAIHNLLRTLVRIQQRHERIAPLKGALASALTIHQHHAGARP